MKVFWVYAWDQYYPTAALGDLKGTFATYKEASDFAATLDPKRYDGGIEIEDVSHLL